MKAGVPASTTAPPIRDLAIADGTVSALCWDGPSTGPGDPAAPHILFLHATGMCAAVYADLLAPLATRYRVTAIDARGHGRTRLPVNAHVVPTDWRPYREDLKQVVEALGGGPLLLAGHSFGATVCFEAAVETPGLASAVLMFDPAFIPFADAASFRALRDGGETPPNIMADRAARRSAAFPSRAAARAAWAGRGVFAGWPDAALDAYVSDGMIEAPDGSARLACSPAWESTSFRGASTTMERSVRAAADLPFAIIAADIDMGSTVGEGTEAIIRAVHPDRPFHRIPGAGHFFPVTHAAQARAWLWRMADRDFAQPGARADR